MTPSLSPTSDSKGILVAQDSAATVQTRHPCQLVPGVVDFKVNTTFRKAIVEKRSKGVRYRASVSIEVYPIDYPDLLLQAVAMAWPSAKS